MPRYSGAPHHSCWAWLMCSRSRHYLAALRGNSFAGATGVLIVDGPPSRWTRSTPATKVSNITPGSRLMELCVAKTMQCKRRLSTSDTPAPLPCAPLPISPHGAPRNPGRTEDILSIQDHPRRRSPKLARLPADRQRQTIHLRRADLTDQRHYPNRTHTRGDHHERQPHRDREPRARSPALPKRPATPSSPPTTHPAPTTPAPGWSPVT